MQATTASRFKVFLSLGLFATLVLFVISPDSYTHYPFGRADSAWFFMCGKAWMNGLLPYVDFADSKGPLLWLIYGVGYLFSPHSYHGVFWISCLWYAFIYYYAFLTAEIFLKDRRKSFLCAILMTLAYFNCWIHNETRAEDFATLFMMLSLYHTSKLLYAENVGPKANNVACLVLGVCFSSLLLIKFSIAAMQTIFILTTGFHLIRTKQFRLRHLMLLAGGALAILLPFVVYFLCMGNFRAFIQEYFINTLATVSYQENPILTYIGEWLHVILKPYATALLIIGGLGAWLLGFKLRRYRYFPLVAFLFVFGLTIRHALWCYYYSICSTVFIFLFVFLLMLPIQINRIRIAAATCLVFGYVSISNLLSPTTLGVVDNIFWKNSEGRKHFYNIEAIMSQVENPRILNFGHEVGHGITCNSLPAGKYWASQSGATRQMRDEHDAIVIRKDADFIFFSNVEYLERDDSLLVKDKYRITAGLLDSLGYKECYRFGEDEEGKGAQALFSNRKEALSFKLPSED